jgi:beta-galactosidase
MANWETVTLPHTWNAGDVMDDNAGYYRGIAWYKRKLVIPRKLIGKQLFLHFEGANQVAEVFVNGKKAGEHIGGYSAFVIPISSLVDVTRDNEIMVKVDNSHDQDIAPLSADFTFYGGIYRDVWLVSVDAVHFSFNEEGDGIYITTPLVDAKSATVQVSAGIDNDSTITKKVRLLTMVKNKAGKVINSVSQVVAVDPGNSQRIVQPLMIIKNPILWSPESPYLYKVVSEIREFATDKVLDIKTHPLGLRWFHFDAARGFFLNGKSCKLVGTSRHQDFKGLGNAIPDSITIKDIMLLKKMGGNFLRVAHYPQDPSVLAACDSLGLLASVEIPLVNEITETDNFYSNCINMQREMIREHFNHPSVIIWCYMNEVLLRPHYNNDKEKQKEYFSVITRLAQSLDSLTRKEDPYRYTMMAHHGDYNKYHTNGLVEIPMIVGWNLYSGWYGANLNDFPAFLDTFHAKHPTIPMLVSEYGADADPRIRSNEPVRFDKSVEYTTRLHQFYFTEMQKRPFVAAAMIWNLADFNSETRTESMPHINNKGLLEWDRTPKDPYYFYEAVLSRKPFLKLLGMQPAAGIADSNQVYCTRIIQVATNLPEAEVFINGNSEGIRKAENSLCQWKVPFINGNNSIEVRGEKNGKKYSEKVNVPFTVLPGQFNGRVPIKQLNILLGANRYFTDEAQQFWIPDREYKKGGWGHVGGRTFKIPRNGRLPYGTDRNIAGTNNDPIYQTQQIGIEKYRLDIPSGEYELTLHFAELLGGDVKDIPYNLSDPDRIEPNGKRIFNVYVNGKLLLDNFDISAQYGPATAVAKTTRVTVTTEGIEITLKGIEGEPVLNGLQVKKLDNNQQSLQYSPGSK